MFKKICNIISAILFTILALLAAVLLLPMLFGFREMVVLSGSMTPTIPVGAVVYAREVDPAALEVGDIITYQMGSGNTVVTHRVIALHPAENAVETQGDANDTSDGLIAYDRVVGRIAFWIPLLGYLISLLQSPAGFLIGGGTIIVLILTTIVPEALSPTSTKRRRRRRRHKRI